MSLFMFSLLAGLLLHQIVSIIQPEDRSKYRLGSRVVVEFSRGTYATVKATVLAVTIVLFLLVVTLIVARGVHPSEGYAFGLADALTSPRMGAAVFGALVGFLIGNLLNRILTNGTAYEFKASDRLEILLIFVLVILGIGGEEWLRSAAQRINKISVGTTTEIAFSESRPKASRAAAEQPNSSRQTTTDESSGSAGLGKLGDLRDNILGNAEYKYRSDGDFIKILALYERANDPGLDSDEVGALPTQVLGPLGTCLSGIFALNGDSAFIQKQLAKLGDVLRDIVEPQDAAHVVQLKPLLEVVDDVALHAEARVPELASLEKKPAYSCAEIKKTAAEVRKAGANSVIINAQSVGKFKKSNESLHYAATAYASVMAALHHYEASAIAMFKWIDRQEKNAGKIEPRNKGAIVKARWVLLRARFAQGAFVEEWIRARGASASSSLRQYHIDNLKAIIDGMKSFAVIRELSEKNSNYELKPGLLGAVHSEDDGDCSTPDIPKSDKEAGGRPDDEQRYTLGKLFESYLSAKNDYVDHALKHPIVKVRSAARIGDEASDLMKHNLRCVDSSRRARIRARHIDRFVRSEINLMENQSPLKSSDEIRNRIRENQQKLAFAFQLVEAEATRDRLKQAESDTLQGRLQPEPTVEVYETLFATQEQLRDFTDREVTP
jgi:hypothetical protein